MLSPVTMLLKNIVTSPLLLCNNTQFAGYPAPILGRIPDIQQTRILGPDQIRPYFKMIYDINSSILVNRQDIRPDIGLDIRQDIGLGIRPYTGYKKVGYLVHSYTNIEEVWPEGVGG